MAFNWKLRIDFFHPLEEEDLRFFAPPGEVYTAANSYNVALQYFHDGKEKEATQRIAQISKDFPLFPQASHLYAVLLAAEGEFEEAETYMGRVRLLELDEKQREQVEEEFRILNHEAAKLRRDRAKIARREEMLTPIKKEIAFESILHKVSSDSSNDSEDYVGEAAKPVFANPEEKRKTIITAMVGVSVGLLILLFFMFFLRPTILKEQERRAGQVQRLEWLEENLAKRASDSEEFASLLSDYQQWIEAGRPKPEPLDAPQEKGE